MEMAKAVAFLVLLLVSPTAYAINYDVGDQAGWAININYATWIGNKSFTTDDTLVFNYVSPHTVDVVLDDDFNNCTTRNAISSFSPGPTNITLNATGTWYFICSVPNHCTLGQKLAINVTAGTGNTIPSSPAAPAPADGPILSSPAAPAPADGSVPSSPAGSPAAPAPADGSVPSSPVAPAPAAPTDGSIPSSPAVPAPADDSIPSSPAATSPGTPPSTATSTPPSVAATLYGGNCLMVGLMSLVLMATVGMMG